MKRTLSIIGLVLAFAWLGSTAGYAQEVTSLRVHIPFAFQVGKESFPAGQYRIEVGRAATGASLGSRLTLRSVDGKTSVLLPTLAPQGTAIRTRDASLRFHKYDQTYFLARVDTSDLGCDLVRSHTEKQMASTTPQQREQVQAKSE